MALTDHFDIDIKGPFADETDFPAVLITAFCADLDLLPEDKLFQGVRRFVTVGLLAFRRIYAIEAADNELSGTKGVRSCFVHWPPS